MNERIPLSSVATVMLTEPTRQRLIDLGVPESDMTHKTELWGQSILSLRGPDQDDSGAPVCFKLAFDPANDLCAGCAWMADCWWRDRSYLAGIKSRGYPPGVPRKIVEARLKAIKSQRSPPPRRSKRRPPPRRKT